MNTSLRTEKTYNVCTLQARKSTLHTCQRDKDCTYMLNLTIGILFEPTTRITLPRDPGQRSVHRYSISP